MLKINLGNWEKDANGQYKRVGDLPYTVERSGENALTFTRGAAVKTVKVADADGYIYKVLKRSIKAAGGAAGLYSFFDREIRNSNAGGFFPVVCNKVFDYMS